MEEFVPVDGVYNITQSQKGALEGQLRNQLSINNNSKKGVTHKTMIDGEMHIMKNRGNVKNPIWYLKPEKQLKGEHQKRAKAMTYGDFTTEEARKKRKFLGKPNPDPIMADEAYMHNAPTYTEHSTAAQSGVKMPEGIGTDDLENVTLRFDKEFDTLQVKSTKDDFEKISKKSGNPWATFLNPKTDEVQVVNIEEYYEKGEGRFVDIFNDGVTLDRAEVTAWDKALKTGKLGNFPIKKAAYLLKELNKNPGIKLLKGTALVGIPALLDAVVAADGFTQLAKEEITARDKVLAGLQAYSATAGLASLTPAAPVALPTSIATGLIHTGITMMDSHKVKKKTEMLMSLGLEELPNGEVVDRIGKRHAGPLYDEKTGEWIGPTITQGHVKKLTSRGSR